MLLENETVEQILQGETNKKRGFAIMDERLKCELVFIVMMIAHVLADFYFQSSKLAQDKVMNPKAMVKHILLYSAVIFIVMCTMTKLNLAMIMSVLLLCVTHAVVDSTKFLVQKRIKTNALQKADYVFYIDQFLHVFCIVIVWYSFGKRMEPRDFTAKGPDYLQYYPITIFLCVLLLLKPTSLFITKSGFLMSSNKVTSLGIGEKIGYLERLTILACIMYGNVSAIGFVITAKSIARFPELNASTDSIDPVEMTSKTRKAEYYIIGTLLSVVATFAVALSFGLFITPVGK